MDEEIEGLSDVMRAMDAQSRARSHEHVAPELLISYHFGEVPRDRAQAIVDHLAICRECASTLLGFIEFFSEEEGPQVAYPKEESLAGWADLQQRLGLTPDKAETQQSMTRPLLERINDLFFPRGFAYALGALLIIVSVSVFIWIVPFSVGDRAQIAQSDAPHQSVEQGYIEAQNRQPEPGVEETGEQGVGVRAEASQPATNTVSKPVTVNERRPRGERRSTVNQSATPQINGPIFVLNIVGTQRDLIPEPVEIKAPARASRYNIFLHLPTHEAKYSNYDVEITDQGGNTIMLKKNLRKATPEGLLLRDLRGESLPLGLYRFEVYAGVDDARTRVGERLVNITVDKEP